METMKIKSKASGYCLINASDFDAKTMKKATAAEVKAADIKNAKENAKAKEQK